MRTPVAPLNLLWFQGNITEYLKSQPSDINKTIFALFHTADLQYSFDYLRALAQGDYPPDQKEMVKVSVALVQFLAGAISDSANTLATIKADLLSNSSGVGRDFFTSTYVHLLMLLKNNGKEIEKIAKEINPLFQSNHIIGDSHVLSHGFLKQSESFYLRPMYVPGLKLRHLADPKQNVFKTGFCNSLQFSSRDKITYLCIGEIDYRISTDRKLGTSLSFGGNPQGKQLTNNCLAIEGAIARRAVEFIYQYKSISQQYAVLSIQPPNPNFVPENFDQQDLNAEVDLIKSVNESIRRACVEFDLFFIDRTEELSSSDGLLDKSHLLDNKHIKYSVHKKILDDFLNSIV